MPRLSPIGAKRGMIKYNALRLLGVGLLGICWAGSVPVAMAEPTTQDSSSGTTTYFPPSNPSLAAPYDSGHSGIFRSAEGVAAGRSVEDGRACKHGRRLATSIRCTRSRGAKCISAGSRAGCQTRGRAATRGDRHRDAACGRNACCRTILSSAGGRTCTAAIGYGATAEASRDDACCRSTPATAGQPGRSGCARQTFRQGTCRQQL